MDLKRMLIAAIEAKVGEAGKRQDHIADTYGVTRTDISLIRRGKAYEVFSTDKAIALAGAFGIGFKGELVQIETAARVVPALAFDDTTGVF